MSRFPRLVVDLAKVEHNARTVVRLAARHGIAVTGVTKVACGDPAVAGAMLAGGVARLGDSRVENLARLREAFPDVERTLLRLPMPGEADAVVADADVSLCSEPAVVERLGAAAVRRGKRHGVILMVELGDLREGLEREQVHPAVERILRLDGVRLLGLGMNLACYGGVVPTPAKVAEFDALVASVERDFGMALERNSGGNSANIPLLLAGHPASRINDLRIGEGIVLGLETVRRRPIPQAHQDTVTFEAVLVEVQEKASLPDGEIAQNAFGETPAFEDLGRIRRGILAGGRQDVKVEGLTPLGEGVSILGASSDHLLVRLASGDHRVGDVLAFRPDYGALLAAYTSPYVEKVRVRSRG